MTAPLADSSDFQEPESLTRLTAEYENLGKRFILAKTAYTAQYAQIYFTRLMQLTPVIKSRCQKEWPEAKHVKLLCLEDDKDQVVSGTLYKNMKLKPTALLEYTQDKSIAAQLNAESFCDDSDSLVIEDESARVSLVGDHLEVAKLVSGVIIAVRGTFDSQAGVFVVKQHLFAGMPNQVLRPPLTQDKYVVVASGLALGDSAGGEGERISLLLDWLKGMLGDEAASSQIVRLVIAGGTFADVESLATATSASRQQRFAMQGVHDMDRTASQFASALPTDLMPGPGDLSNYAMPQQPCHRCLFPGATPYASFQRVSNPHDFTLDGVRILGTSGQNVQDMQRYVSDTSALQVMHQNLVQRHLCPTAPDTLSCYPFSDEDPFVLDFSPHVYFCGNQKAFATTVVQGDAGQAVTLLSVPSFARTGVVALVNLRTLECRPMHFDAAL